MTIKRLLLLFMTLAVSLSCVYIMNTHYDVLSRYMYEISDEDADKLRNNLTYKEINYLIDYSISYELFIDYIEEEGFNVYHFPLYNRIKDFTGELYSNAKIVYFAEKSIKLEIDEDNLINYLGMGYSLETIIGFYQENDSLFKSDVLAIDPLNYDFSFNNSQTIYNLYPYDLVTVDFINNSNSWMLRSRVATKLLECLTKVDENVSFNVFNRVEITRGFESYDAIVSNRKQGDKSLVAGKNYYQLGRMFTLSRSDVYSSAFFEKFNEYAEDYGFVLVNEETNEYLYIGK